MSFVNPQSSCRNNVVERCGSGLLVISHLAWFRFFLHDPRCATVSVEWVLGFMLVTLWIVPFAFFISFAANESVLPGGGAPYQGYVRHGKITSAALLRFHSLVRNRHESVFLIRRYESVKNFTELCLERHSAGLWFLLCFILDVSNEVLETQVSGFSGFL